MDFEWKRKKRWHCLDWCCTASRNNSSQRLLYMHTWACLTCSWWSSFAIDSGSSKDPFHPLPQNRIYQKPSRHMYNFLSEGVELLHYGVIVTWAQMEDVYNRKRSISALGHSTDTCTMYISEFQDLTASKTPSNNILTKCFLTNFLTSENSYIKVLRSINVTGIISFDHTFKSAMNVGYLREDGVWIPQYNSLF